MQLYDWSSKLMVLESLLSLFSFSLKERRRINIFWQRNSEKYKLVIFYIFFCFLYIFCLGILK